MVEKPQPCVNAPSIRNTHRHIRAENIMNARPNTLETTKEIVQTAKRTYRQEEKECRYRVAETYTHVHATGNWNGN